LSEAKGRRIALVTCGWLTAATLHGLYDWTMTIQAVLPTIIAGLSFMLLSLYLSDRKKAEETAAGAAKNHAGRFQQLACRQR